MNAKSCRSKNPARFIVLTNCQVLRMAGKERKKIAVLMSVYIVAKSFIILSDNEPIISCVIFECNFSLKGTLTILFNN